MLDPTAINPLALPSVPLSEQSQLPITPCIYFAIDSQGVIQYIGRSVNLAQRWVNHHKYETLLGMEGVRIAYLQTDADLLYWMEVALIEWFKPPLNATLQKQSKEVTSNNYTSKVAHLRKINNLTQRQLADLVGVTETTVRNWENNRSGVEWFERISKLCNALQCTPNDLFGYEKVGESEENA